MTLQATSNQVSQSLLDSVNGSKASKKNSVSDIQDRFMTLLITQMKNQDPLNPMDNAQVTSQMAQLSTVTGIDKLNATLETMMSNAQNSQSLQASSLIGHAVLVAGDKVHFDGNIGNFGIELPSAVDQMTITIQDAAGNQLRKITTGKQNEGVIPLSWDGYTDSGTRVANGDYKVSVSAKSGGNAATANLLSLEQVVSISAGATGVKLNLGNASSVSTAEVKQIF